ncbi:hypothetical protein [Dyadobacter sp. LHD-138]|uniref:hypothetical protein n=1 Tax=Dyadobacter sp. LHD-138 TaxID=3071413 RepID=UPI0027E0F4D2|nr:hypothetical protein [Dyadobacter sp. LHD-138]MDQ6480558.1 hypothetical protein [Dyadobacter sp. LHD-138]
MKRLIGEEPPVMGVGFCQMTKKYLAGSIFVEVDSFWQEVEASGAGWFDLVSMDMTISVTNSVQMEEKIKTVFLLTRFINVFEWCLNLLPGKTGADKSVSKKASGAESRLAFRKVLFMNGRSRLCLTVPHRPPYPLAAYFQENADEQRVCPRPKV